MLVNVKQCVQEYRNLENEYIELLKKYSDVIDKLNKKGGLEFLKNGVMPSESNINFTKNDLQDLLLLCHPDKHGGSKTSNEVTRKIILMRKMQKSY